jgi:hypothetical protein
MYPHNLPRVPTTAWTFSLQSFSKEKVFDGIQQPFMIKTSKNQEDRDFLSTIAVIRSEALS